VGIERFEQLEVWQQAHGLVLLVYQTTSAFPPDEKFGLISQMRRAAVSVPANIAEGFKRRGLRDKAHFYNIAQSSLEELRYYFILCRDLGYGGESIPLAAKAEQVARMLNGLIQSLRR
jgi:four helix bundle protein